MRESADGFSALVSIPTVSIAGGGGLLDFKFASLEPVTANARLSITTFDAHGGELGRAVTAGIVRGELSLDGTLALVNTPQQHASEYSIVIRFGRRITFRFAFEVGEPQGSAFGFSLLDSSGRGPLLLAPDWQRLDPSGFAFLADLDGGELSVGSYLAEGSIQMEGRMVP